ncbi:MAG TPA: hypothetical protein VK034_11080 [Enhygromyxa sp.]|nr:hypothetical protein [Enhygromyxa sp.]
MASDAQLLETGRRAIASVINLALTCPAGGDARWDAMLGQLGVTPLAADERARHLREGPGQSRGALLLELRWALEAAIEPLCEHMDDGYVLRTAADQAVRDYVGAVKPKITTSSIFANAMAGIATSPGRITGAAEAAADRCSCCGAPRQDRSSNTCRYCGETL